MWNRSKSVACRPPSRRVSRLALLGLTVGLGAACVEGVDEDLDELPAALDQDSREAAATAVPLGGAVRFEGTEVLDGPERFNGTEELEGDVIFDGAERMAETGLPHEPSHEGANARISFETRKVMKVYTYRVEVAGRPANPYSTAVTWVNDHLGRCSGGRITATRVGHERVYFSNPNVDAKTIRETIKARRVLGDNEYGWICLPQGLKLVNPDAIGVAVGKWVSMLNHACSDGRQTNINTDAVAHEALHQLGMVHTSGGLMAPSTDIYADRRKCPTRGVDGWPTGTPTELAGKHP